MILELNRIKLSSIIVILFPATLISGPLIPEILSFTLSIYLFIYLIKEKSILILKDKIFLFLILYYIYLLIISLFLIPIENIFKDQFFYFRFIIFSYAIYLILSENRDLLDKICFFFIILFTFLIIDVLIQFFYGKNLLGFVSSTPNRYSGIFGEELVLGSYLSRFFPLIIGLIYINKKLKFNNLIILFFSAFVCLAVFISGERTALGLTFLTILFLCLKKDFRKISIYILIFAVLSLSILSYFNKSQRYRIFVEPLHQMSLLDDEFLKKYSDVATDYSPDNLKNFHIFSSHHHSHIMTGINIFKDNFIIGVGPEQFREKCKDIKYASGSDPCSTHPHNILIQILSETGLIGFIFYLVTIFYLFINIFNKINLKRYNDHKDLEYFILITFIINLWPLLPSGNFFNNWLSFIIFFPLGFYIYTKNLKYGNK